MALDLLSALLGAFLAVVLGPVLIILAVSIRRRWLDGSYLEGISKKYVFITGCDTGFGFLLARQLDCLGCHVIASCLTDEGMQQVTSLLSSRAVVIQMDVTDHESIARAEQKVQEILPSEEGLWGLVNNAGILLPALVDFETVEGMKHTSEVNLWGTVAVTKSFLHHVKKGRGRIVNLGSVASRMTFPAYSSYCISKYGVAAFTACLRLEMDMFGVSVHLIEPTGFKTSMIDFEKNKRYTMKVWERAPEEIKAEYNKEWFERGAWYYKDTLMPAELELVTNCIEHALFSTKPKCRYFPGGLAWLFLWWFSLLPAEVTDAFIGKIHQSTNPLKNPR